MRVDPGAFLVLARDAARDAVRGRGAAAMAALGLLAVAATRSCTSCFDGRAVVNGEEIDLARFAGAAGLPLLVTLSLAVQALAVVLAEEALRRPLERGTAALWLARPVSRETYAAARLAGVMAVAGVAAAAFFGSAALLLHLRQGLDPRPALVAAGASAVGATALASLAMLLSLALPRLATLALLAGGAAAVALANGLSLFGARLEGLLGLVDRLGPPLVAAVVLPLADWAPWLPIRGHSVELALRLSLWALFGLAALLLAFRRMDLP